MEKGYTLHIRVQRDIQVFSEDHTNMIAKFNQTVHFVFKLAVVKIYACKEQDFKPITVCWFFTFILKTSNPSISWFLFEQKKLCCVFKLKLDLFLVVFIYLFLESL